MGEFWGRFRGINLDFSPQNTLFVTAEMRASIALLQGQSKAARADKFVVFLPTVTRRGCTEATTTPH